MTETYGKLTIGESVVYGWLDIPHITHCERISRHPYELPAGTIDFIIDGGPVVTLQYIDGIVGGKFEVRAMFEYTPTADEGWALVDLLKDILEDFTDEPQFTRAEHALMAAGQIRREWLAEHDAQLVEKLADEIAFSDYTAWERRNAESAAEDWLRARAAELRSEGNV